MAELPEDLEALLVEYGRHLRLGRNRSEHTVRAYLGDARSLLEHLYTRSADSAIRELDLLLLRSWLAQQAAGARLARLWHGARRRRARSRHGSAGPAGCPPIRGCGWVPRRRTASFPPYSGGNRRWAPWMPRSPVRRSAIRWPCETGR